MCIYTNTYVHIHIHVYVYIYAHTYIGPGALAEQVRAAASLAQLDTVVQGLPQGLASPVGEHGSS